MSGTPRTDALWKPRRVECDSGSGNHILLFADNCRDEEYELSCRLERELAEARATGVKQETHDLACRMLQASERSHAALREALCSSSIAIDLLLAQGETVFSTGTEMAAREQIRLNRAVLAAAPQNTPEQDALTNQIEITNSERAAKEVAERKVVLAQSYLRNRPIAEQGTTSHIMLMHELKAAPQNTPEQALQKLADWEQENRPEGNTEPGTYAANGRWMIVYDDTEVQPEHYTDEAAARHRLGQAAANWNCHLYTRIATTARDTIAPSPCITEVTDGKS